MEDKEFEEEDTISRLTTENEKLERLVLELQNKISQFEERTKSVTQRSKSEITQVIKLLKRKDDTIENSRTEIEEKNKKLEEAISELHKKMPNFLYGLHP